MRKILHKLTAPIRWVITAIKSIKAEKAAGDID